MPSPVVLKVQFADAGPALKPMANAKMLDDTTALVTWPVDVWFNGSRTFKATLDFGGRAITTITLDPGCRFPDRDPSDNVWPKPAARTLRRLAADRQAGGAELRDLSRSRGGRGSGSGRLRKACCKLAEI